MGSEGDLYVYNTLGGTEDITSSLSQVNDTYNTTGAELTRQAVDSILAVFSNGIGITINVTEGLPNFVLALPPSLMGQTRGLLGNSNSNSTDDFTPRGATQPLNDSITEEEIFEFGKSCEDYLCMHSYNFYSYLTHREYHSV